MCNNGLDTMCLIDFRILIGTLNGPVALLQFNLSISFSISWIVINSKLKFLLRLGGMKSKGDLFEVGIDSDKFLPTFVK